MFFLAPTLLCPQTKRRSNNDYMHSHCVHTKSKNHLDWWEQFSLFFCLTPNDRFWDISRHLDSENNKFWWGRLLCWVFCCTWAFSRSSERGLLSLQYMDFSLQWFLLLRFSASRAQAQQLWHTGLVALKHAGSSWPRYWTVSPASAGRFLSTTPPGKSRNKLL